MSEVKQLVQEAFNRQALVDTVTMAANDSAAHMLGSRAEFLEAFADVLIAAAFDVYAKAAQERGEPASAERIAESMTLALEVSRSNGRTIQ